MTREEWAARLPLIQAFVEGKGIQFKYSGMDNPWTDIDDPVFNLPDCEYRIKPETDVVWISDDWEIFEEEKDAVTYCQRQEVSYKKYVEVVE